MDKINMNRPSISLVINMEKDTILLNISIQTDWSLFEWLRDLNFKDKIPSNESKIRKF